MTGPKSRECVPWIAIACLSLLIFNSTLWSQSATGRILGKITDPTGAVVPGVKVTATNTNTGVNFDTITNEVGDYQILALPIGEYKVTAELPGFQTTISKPEALELNQALRIDIKLEVGQATQTVEVEAAAVTVDTTTAMLGTSIIGAQISNLPLNGRNVLDLALLQPGVVPVPSGGGAGSYSIGGRGDSVTFLLDGGVNNNLLSNAVVMNPNPDAVGEFRVLRNNYGAEYGRNGAGIISVVTRSGTNNFHGTAYDYVRNDALNANSFFNNQNSLRKDILKRNQFGATLGGPVFRDKLFFFSSWQSQRQSQLQVTSRTAIFTPAELNGDFSLSNTTRSGPDANVVAFLQKFPYFQSNAALAAQGIIDPAKFSPVAVNYIKANLIPTDPTGFRIYQSAALANNDEFTQKVDYQPTNNDRFSGTVGWKSQTTLSPFALANVEGYPSDTFSKQYFLAINYVKTITPTLLNEFRFTAQRNNSFQAVPAAQAPKPRDLGIAINSDNPTGPPILGFSSGMTVGFSNQGPSRIIDNTFTWADSLTWTKGKHTFKTGVTFSPYQDNQVFDFYINGEFFFRGSTGTTVYSSNDHANFLMGLADEFEQYPAAPSNIRSKNLGLFFQDEWKTSSHLTLTLGLRYEYNTPKLDTQGRTFNYIYGAHSTVFPGAPVGLVFPGDPGAPRGSNFPDKNDFGPRFGFAWSPTADGRLSIRGGGGIFYDILKAEDNFQFNGQKPFFPTADLIGFPALTNNPTSAPQNFSSPYVAYGTPNPFPAAPPTSSLNFAAAGFLPFGGSGVDSVDVHLRTPYIYQYSLDVQKELKGGMVADLAYAGSDSHKLTGIYDANPFPLGGTTRILNSLPGNPSNAFNYLSTFGNVANAHYDSLQVRFQRDQKEAPVVGNAGYLFSYTFSKSIDNASGFRSRDNAVPYYNHGLFKSVSDFDIPQYISLSGVWEVPFQNMWRSGPSRLLSGWNLWPIVTYTSGNPLDVTSGLIRSITNPGPSGAGDQNLVRANLISPLVNFDPKLHQTLRNRPANYWFDPSIFSGVPTAASVGNYGTFPRNALRAPGIGNVNLTISKLVPVRENLRMEYRADFFNLLNHAQFLAPNTSITNSAFGQISTTQSPRIIQMALRLQF